MLAVLGGVLIAGCGPGPAGGTAGHAARPVITASPGGPCSGPARLAAGVSVAAWRLDAIRFVSATAGVGLTAPDIPCARSLGSMGTEVSEQAQPVRLALTRDGGRHWVTAGGTLPGTADLLGVQVAAASGAAVWVFSPAGLLLVTRDEGATWARQPLPAPVVAAGSAGGWLWALSCPPVSKTECRPVAERMRLPGGTWSRTRPVVAGTVQAVSLTVWSGRAAVVTVSGDRPALVRTTDGGAHWSARPAPADPGYLCAAGATGSFTASGPGDWWLLCLGGAAAGSSNKALLRSTDAGRTWTVAATAVLSDPPQPGSLPLQDGAVIAASPAGRLWIATPNTLNVSTDGGARWSRVVVNPGGYFGQFDVLSGTAAWLLAPGGGLWQTTDAARWHAVGGTGPG